MILYFAEFLAYIEIVKYGSPQTCQFFFKKDEAYRDKKDFLTDSIALIREKTLNTLSPFYEYPDRFLKTDCFPL